MLIYLGFDGVERELQSEGEIVDAIRSGWLTPDTQVRFSGMAEWQTFSTLPNYQRWVALAEPPQPAPPVQPTPPAPPLPPPPPAHPSQPQRSPWLKVLLWVGSVILAAFVLVIVIALLVPDDEPVAPPPRPTTSQQPAVTPLPTTPGDPLNDPNIPAEVKAWAEAFMADMEALGDELDYAYARHDFFAFLDTADDFGNPQQLALARQEINQLFDALLELEVEMHVLLDEAVAEAQAIDLPVRDRLDFLTGLLEGQQTAKDLLTELFELQFLVLHEFDEFLGFMELALEDGRYIVRGEDLYFNNEADSLLFDEYLENIDYLMFEIEELMWRFEEFASEGAWQFPEI